jgi:hypothetical protein
LAGNSALAARRRGGGLSGRSQKKELVTAAGEHKRGKSTFAPVLDVDFVSKQTGSR